MQEPSFDAAVEAFAAYRPSYPDLLFDQILEHLPPPRAVALDLGSGTGLSALPLCERFDSVIAVEPAPEMAKRLHDLSPRLHVRNCRAEELEPSPPHPVDLATAGCSFYWMEAEPVLERLRGWVRPGGLFAAYRYGFPRVSAPLGDLLRREMAERWDPFRHPRLRDEGHSLRVLRKVAGFAQPAVFGVANVVDLGPRELVGFLRSTSYGAAFLRSIPDPGPYLLDLEHAVREAGGERFPVDFGLEVILTQRASGAEPDRSPAR